MQPLAQFSGPGQALHVPAEVLSELDGGATPIRLVFLGHVSVLERDTESLLNAWVGTHGPSLQQVTRLVEDPRLSERAACDHDACASGLTMHADGIVGCLDVAVAEHGNRERIDDGGDLVPTRRAGVHLRSGTRMEGEHARAGVLAATGDRHGITHLFVPAAANL